MSDPIQLHHVIDGELVDSIDGQRFDSVNPATQQVWATAPRGSLADADRALAAAEDMLRFVEVGNEGWYTKYGVRIELAIGVNSGPTIVGNIGSESRMEYTAIGDTVNVAARLEAIAAPNQILVGEATERLAGDEFSLTLLGERKLTGRQHATKVFTLES